MIQPHVKRNIWLLWLFVVPVGIWLTYHYYPPVESLLNIDILGFLLLTFFVASTPMIINNTPVFYIQWVSLTVFLTYGLFAEVILMQLALVVVLMRIRLPKEHIYRFPLNWFMFFIVSVASGLIYYAIGGTHGIDIMSSPKNLVLAFVYAFSYFFLNHFTLTLFAYLVQKRRREIFDQDFIWEAVTTTLTLPIGLVLYILYHEVGLVSIFFVGVPFASLAVILNLYHSSDKVNHYLQNAAEIGHELAERLHVEEVIDLYIQKLTGMLPVDYAYILDVVDDELQLIRRVEKDTDEFMDVLPLKKNEGISGHVWKSGKAVLYHSQKEWKDIVEGYMPKSVESIICVPIVRSNEVIGILLLASQQKRAYEKSQLMIVDILCSYFAVAIENAKHYERTKEDSERCALTKLYNYRFIERKLNEEYNLLVSGKRTSLSVIMLDIDHFKSVNDTYGHQSGNEILQQIGNRLAGYIEEETGIVARYGGEEFLIVLPDVDKYAALQMAEIIRQIIANRPFVLTEHIQEDQPEITVQITASIGVACAPIDADDAMSLIRHADRALYVGAKQNGRNKVAEYVK
ncbi:GGDEF domain-containing protein [Robertmurraya kyonggiensis]|uniref:GGDEF domain-containing protein n=1 Tax=Robertmurraya kyonggiensis TaxID=1037680 RepID=A0A4U1D1M3_9BACI|nr:sensor domain-containing diguanylate cyclase [Robertmurraya kyonggiensis]TKC15633.1 GGDEF domain-containing protein [Robertmurraya kyonggiensis]